MVEGRGRCTSGSEDALPQGKGEGEGRRELGCNRNFLHGIPEFYWLLFNSTPFLLFPTSSPIFIIMLTLRNNEELIIFYVTPTFLLFSNLGGWC